MCVIYFLNLKKSQASQDLITIYDHIDGLAPLHFISEHTFAICYRPSVCPSVCLSSVKFVRPTQAIEIFGNISAALGTLAIR